MKNRVGEKYQTNEGYTVTITSYRGSEDCDVQFDNGVVLENRTFGNITLGRLKNPYHPSVCGVGYVGLGKYKAKRNGTLTNAYNIWAHMIKRCYSVASLREKPTYIGCSVDERWHNFQVFAEWFAHNYVEWWSLDKDILFKGNKIYSPETCCFVPQEINKLFVKANKTRGNLPIGVSSSSRKFEAALSKGGKREIVGYFRTPEKAFKAYKRAKEKEIKDVARVCKNLITEPCYQALINYKVEIND